MIGLEEHIATKRLEGNFVTDEVEKRISATNFSARPAGCGRRLRPVTVEMLVLNTGNGNKLLLNKLTDSSHELPWQARPGPAAP